MAANLVYLREQYLDMARRLVEAKPKEAAEYGIDRDTINQAESFMNNPLFSTYLEETKNLQNFILSQTPASSNKFISRNFARLVSGDFTPKGESTWQAQTKDYAKKAEWDDEMVDIQAMATDYAAFIKSAMQDLRSYNNTPYSPLLERGQALLHRLWSFERRWDRELPRDLESWMNDFDWQKNNSPGLAEHLQESTAMLMRDLMDPFSIRMLGVEVPGKFMPEHADKPWVVDSAWIMLNRDKRFAEFAAPIAGATLFIDMKSTWKTSFEDVFPAHTRLPSHELFLDWITPEQDLMETTRDLGKAGLISLQGEAPIVIGKKQMTAPIISFSDYNSWYYATPALSDFNKRTNDTPANSEKLVNNVTDSYLKLAELGYLSLDPQFYVHRKTGTVRLAGLPAIFQMTEFPYRFFIESVADAIITKFNLESDRTEIVRQVRQKTLQFLNSGRLQKDSNVADLPGSQKELLNGKKVGGIAKGEKSTRERIIEKNTRGAYQVCCGGDDLSPATGATTPAANSSVISTAAGAGAPVSVKK